jgi:hypothetical protein
MSASDRVIVVFPVPPFCERIAIVVAMWLRAYPGAAAGGSGPAPRAIRRKTLDTGEKRYYSRAGTLFDIIEQQSTRGEN